MRFESFSLVLGGGREGRGARMEECCFWGRQPFTMRGNSLLFHGSLSGFSLSSIVSGNGYLTIDRHCISKFMKPLWTGLSISSAFQNKKGSGSFPSTFHIFLSLVSLQQTEHGGPTVQLSSERVCSFWVCLASLKDLTGQDGNIKAWTFWPDVGQLWWAIYAPEVPTELAEAWITDFSLHGYCRFPLPSTGADLLFPLCRTLSVSFWTKQTTTQSRALYCQSPMDAQHSCYLSISPGWERAQHLDSKDTENQGYRFSEFIESRFSKLCSGKDVKEHSLPHSSQCDNIWELQHTILLFGGS